MAAEAKSGALPTPAPDIETPGCTRDTPPSPHAQHIPRMIPSMHLRTASDRLAAGCRGTASKDGFLFLGPAVVVKTPVGLAVG